MPSIFTQTLAFMAFIAIPLAHAATPETLAECSSANAPFPCAPTHTQPPDPKPSEPIRVFGLRMPFKTSPITGRHVLSLTTEGANTWSQTLAIAPPGDDADATADLPDSYKIYGADGVIRSGRLQYTTRITDAQEVEVALNMFMLVNGGSWADFLVSDTLIEAFHTSYGEDDLFDRRQNGLNKAGIIFRDRDRNVMKLNDGDLFLGTVDIGTTKYVDLIKNERVLLTLNFGAFAGIPLNSFNSHLALGGSVGSALSVRLGEHNSITTALALQAQHEKVIPIRESKMNFKDNDVLAAYQFLIAYNYDMDGGGRFSGGFEFYGPSSPLSKDKNPNRAELAAAHYTSNQVGSDRLLDRKFDSLINSSEYISAFIALKPSGFLNALTFYLFVQEDWKVFKSDDRGNRAFVGSTNAQDWKVGVKVRGEFGDSD